jgi:dihydrofolate synthase / folylpolyglutamate synthase
VNLREAQRWLDGHLNLEAGPSVTAGVVDGLSLDRMRTLVGALGDPQQAYPVIHLTGTNGKGSTARMLDAVLRGHGLSVGLYTSPHLERLNERLVWDGRPIDDEELASVLSEVAAVESLVEGDLSWFELVTAAAFAWFAEQAVDVAVVEVGLLGRYDATNVADGLVAVVTNVGKDHTDGGEGWREAIAREKAGIIKPGSTLVLGETDEGLRRIFESEGAERVWRRDRDVAAERNRVAVGGRVVDVRTPFGVLEDVFLPAHGAHQGENLALAVGAGEAFFDRALDRDLVVSALAEVSIPGRFEIMGREPLLVLDGAHNVDGVRALETTLADDFTPVPVTVVVLGMLSGRDPQEMVEALELTPYDVVICTTPPSPRALPAAEVAAAVQESGLEVEVVPDVVEAVGRARALAGPEDRIIVTGSLYVVGAARAVLD